MVEALEVVCLLERALGRVVCAGVALCEFWMDDKQLHMRCCSSNKFLPVTSQLTLPEGMAA